MSAVSEAVSQRMTLGGLSDSYGWTLDPPYAGGVTVTSIVDDLRSVRPGALYLPSTPADAERLARASVQGACGAVVPPSFDGDVHDIDIPVLRGTPTARQLGEMAATLAGDPSALLAVFAVVPAGEGYVERAADMLHMLGNPVGVVSSAGSSSLERPLALDYPLGILDMQRILSVCAEDGAAAVVIALDDATLRPEALQGTSVDVLGVADDLPGRIHERYGFTTDSELQPTRRSAESDALALRDGSGRPDPTLSLAIAMALAAGVRRANVRSALRTSEDLR